MYNMYLYAFTVHHNTTANYDKLSTPTPTNLYFFCGLQWLIYWNALIHHGQQKYLIVGVIFVIKDSIWFLLVHISSSSFKLFLCFEEFMSSCCLDFMISTEVSSIKKQKNPTWHYTIMVIFLHLWHRPFSPFHFLFPLFFFSVHLFGVEPITPVT